MFLVTSEARTVSVSKKRAGWVRHQFLAYLNEVDKDFKKIIDLREIMKPQ